MDVGIIGREERNEFTRMCVSGVMPINIYSHYKKRRKILKWPIRRNTCDTKKLPKIFILKKDKMIKIRYISIFDVVDWSPDIILHVFWAERSSLIRIVAQRKDKWRYAFKYFVSFLFLFIIITTITELPNYHIIPTSYTKDLFWKKKIFFDIRCCRWNFWLHVFLAYCWWLYTNQMEWIQL